MSGSLIETVATELGGWIWWLAGFALLAAELAVPGVFLVWIGAAAIVIGAVSLMAWGAPWWGFEVQLIAFALISVAFVLAGRRYFSSAVDSDQPLLNRRVDSLVGRTAVLSEPIREGRGRIRLDDSWWPVEGPDLAEGARVRVVSASGNRLTVVAA